MDIESTLDGLFNVVRQLPGNLTDFIYKYAWVVVSILVLALIFEVGIALYTALWRRWRRVDDCVFCQIVAGRSPATVVAEWRNAIAIVPIDPVCEGHVLVLPKTHVDDARVSPRLTGRIARWAAELGRQHHAVNLITSCGREATQSIKHLHWHVAPRRANDGLPLLWTGQVRSGGVSA